MLRLSIVICTYNRVELLAECLESLTVQSLDDNLFEVIVVNNNSSDNTSEVAERFSSKFQHFRLIIEHQVGLSHARNRGFREAKSDWVAYIDDDAKAANNFVEEALNTIDNYDFPFFGGNTLPWYKYEKPFWFKDKYVLYHSPRISKVIPLHGNDYCIGVLMVIKKSLLEEYNGFNVELGMRGDTVGYLEETELQDRIRKDGLTTGYNPNLINYHLVAEYKLKLDWFFVSAFALGRDKALGGVNSTHPANLVLILITGIALTLVNLIIYTPRLIFKGYYIENWLIDVFRKLAKRIGIIYTGLKMRRSNVK